jgi:hypothetical protein
MAGQGRGGGSSNTVSLIFSSHVTHLYHAAGLTTKTPYALDTSNSGGGYVDETLACWRSGCEDDAMEEQDGQ